MLVRRGDADMAVVCDSGAAIWRRILLRGTLRAKMLNEMVSRMSSKESAFS